MLQPIPNKQSSTSVCIQAQLAENFKVMKLHISLDEGLPSPDLVTTCSLRFRDQPHLPLDHLGAENWLQRNGDEMW